MPNMIEVNATSILVFLIYSVVIGATSIMISALLRVNKKDEQERDKFTCVHPTCKRRTRFNEWVANRLRQIVLTEYCKDHNNIPPEGFDKGNNVDEEV
jgi:hypothetical protein